MIRTDLGKSRVRESRMLGSVGAKLNGLATRPTPVEVAFTEWTRDGSLRHAVFVGLRDNQAAREVRRET
jgi:ATP-dependent DNA ligase